MADEGESQAVGLRPTRDPGAIYAERQVRASAGVAVLGALAAASVTLALGALDWVPDAAAIWVLASSVISAPLAAIGSRFRARRRFSEQVQLQLPAMTADDDDARRTLNQHLHAKAVADALEQRSLVWPIAAGAAVSPLIWLALGWPLIDASVHQAARALQEIALVLGPTILTLGLSAARDARELTRRETLSGWWGKGSGTRPLWLAAAVGACLGTVASDGYGVVGGLIAGFFTAASSMTFLMPAFWLARRRLSQERRDLARSALPPPLDSSEETRRWLVAAVELKDAPARTRADALRQLLSVFPLSEVRGTLEAALFDESTVLATMALRVCYERRHKVPLEALLRLVEHKDAAILNWLPQLLRRHADKRVEVALLRLLQHVDHELQIKAAEALGLVGSIDAVEPMRKAAAGGPSKLKETVQEAAERIQIRHGSQGGALSLAPEGERGGVSIAEVESGAVSVLPPPRTS